MITSSLGSKACWACQHGYCDSCSEHSADSDEDERDDGPCHCAEKGHPWRDDDYYRRIAVNMEVDLTFLRSIITVKSDLL